MINGVLQRLTIVEFNNSRLVLREQPLLAWIVGGGCIVLGSFFGLLGFYITTFIAFGIGVFFLADSRTRVITFDVDANTMQVEFVYPYKRKQAETVELHTLARAELVTADDGGSQIVLYDRIGNQMGLSVYSRDVRPWKDEITIAINAILHEAHKDDSEAEI